MKISKIVLTGGPCAGKSTSMSLVQTEFENKGYRVLFVPETATELILGGISGTTCQDIVDFQTYIMRLQLGKEHIFEEAAKKMDCDKVLIICDRGALDGKAFVTEEQFKQVLKNLNKNEVELRDEYDAVFHLVTAAKGAEEFYTLENNAARRETTEEAIEADAKLVSAWTGHPHLRVIDNSTDFSEKMRRTIAEISSFLGEPEPLEIERKFLIEYPDLDWLEQNPNCQRVEIIQTYLNAPEGEESRIRQRGINGHYTYSQTTKKKISDIKRIETERRISKEEYLELLMDADPEKRPIRKTRYCLTHENQYFEIDTYPFWKKKAIMEIELSDENQSISFPEQIKIIKEVTEDNSYKNASLASVSNFSTMPL